MTMYFRAIICSCVGFLIYLIDGVNSSHSLDVGLRPCHQDFECDIHHFKCNVLCECVPLNSVCNGVAECIDGTDEHQCTCGDKLYYKGSSLVCDGEVDCYDGTDEKCNGLFTVCQPSYFYCEESNSCLSNALVCDGKLNCPYGEDERYCGSLLDKDDSDYSKLDIMNLPPIQSAGILHYWNQSNSIYTPACKTYDTNTINFLCNYFGFSNFTFYQNIRDELTYYGNKECVNTHLKCGPQLNGTIPFHHMVIDKSPTENTKIPWAVNVFIGDGGYCSGTLIHESWVATSSNCFRRQQYAFGRNNIYITGGDFRIFRGIRIRSPHHQRRQIIYRTTASDLEIVLLKMRSPFNPSMFLKPTVFTRSPKRHLEECVVTNIHENYLKYPIVFKPANNSFKCLDSICVNGRSFPEELDCSGISEMIVCREKRSKDSQWFLAGAWNYMKSYHKCNKDTIHTRFSQYELNKINRIIGGYHKYNTEEPTIDCTNGHLCDMGKCIPKTKVCDGNTDCADESDEPYSCESVITHVNTTECPEDKFKCNYICLHQSKICNGINECGLSADDEQNCTCRDTFLNADPSKICNGVLDCADESDELFCGCEEEDLFKCYESNNVCINISRVCDRNFDCPNNEDERNCTTLSTIHPPEVNALGIPKTESFGYFYIRLGGVWKFVQNENWGPRNSDQLCQLYGYEKSVDTQREFVGDNFAIKIQCL